MKNFIAVSAVLLFIAVSVIPLQAQAQFVTGINPSINGVHSPNSGYGSIPFEFGRSSLQPNSMLFAKQDSTEGDGLQQYGFYGYAAMDEFGTSVSTAGDVNADGYDDIIVGAPQSDVAFTDGGCAYIFFGGSVVNFDADVTLPGHTASQQFGLCVSAAGDVNNDGYGDVIVGAPSDQNNSQRVYIYYGGPAMDNTADVVLSGQLSLGFSVASAGDVNDDGYSDVIVGSQILDQAMIYFGGNPMNNSADLTLGVINSTFGISVSSAGDVNSDGYSDIVVGAMNASTGSLTYNGAVYIYYGGPSLDNVADVSIFGTVTNERLGNAVSCAGDVNGDGYSDIVTGAFYYDTYRGKAYIFYGGASMDVNPDVTFIGEETGDWLGQSVAGAGDINGDGYDDVLVGAYHNSEFGQEAGKAYLYYGGTNMNNIADNQFTGTSSNAGFGCSLSSAGDFNNDGYKDFLIGEYKNSEAGTESGKAHLYTNTTNLTQISMLKFPGYQPNVLLGNSVAGVGDLNADGFDDLVAGVSNGISGQPGIVYFGGRLMDNAGDVSLYGSPYVSFRVASAGDVNNDGYQDIITGDPFNLTNNVDAGAAFIFLGGQNMSGVPYISLYGTASKDYFGYSISSAGDVNNDGFDDVIVGAPYNDDNGLGAGAAYLYFGGTNMNNTPDVIMFGEFPNDQFGSSVSGGGNNNADQFDDVLVGSPYYSVNFNNAGRIYLFSGGSSMDGNPDMIFDCPPSVTIQCAFGFTMESSGDVNGDSYSDILIGSPGHSGRGRAFVYYGGSLLDNSPDVTLSGENLSYQFAGSAALPGDVNNDGYGDIIIGESAFNNSLEAYKGRLSLFYGGANMNNVADRIIYGESSYDYFGYSVSDAGDVDGDGVNEFVAGAPLNDNAGNNAGMVYLYKGTETATDLDDVELTGLPSVQFGYAVSSAGDFNADGYDDVIVGAPKAYSNGLESGEASIYFGGPVWNKTPDITISGQNSYDHFGTSVSFAGDVNQDSYDDLIIGAPENDAAGTDAGRAYIFFGGPSPDGVPDLIISGESAGDRFGFSVSKAGNVNGDLAGDVIVGAPFSNAGANLAGRSYVYFGGAVMNNVADVIMTVPLAGLWFGISCSFAGDVNGDQYDDVIVGGGMMSGVGNGYAAIFLGGPSMDNVPDVDMNGISLDDHFGYSVSYAGDVNGDQYSDVIVGAYGYDLHVVDAGAAYIFYGAANMNGNYDVYLEGSRESDFFGVSVASAGKVNSDNYDDVIIGACYNDAGGTNAGSANVYFGGPAMDNKRDIVMTGKIPNANFGFAVANAGDLNSDGRGDLAIGGLNSDKVKLFMNSEPVEQLILTLKLAQEGFFDAETQKLNMSDTVTVSLRNSSFPYNQIDICKGVINKVTLEGRFYFNAVPSGNYYLKVKHRNSLETWSANPVRLTKNSNVNYDFTVAAYTAYGFNEKIVNNNPLMYGIYSGDVDNDGAVDATDGSIIDNDVINFVTGYTVTDVTGDYFVDAADYLVADNNAYNFVTKITP